MSDAPQDWRTRCDWCQWPLDGTNSGGCLADNCSQLGVRATTSPLIEARQLVRNLEARLKATPPAGVCVADGRCQSHQIDDPVRQFALYFRDLPESFNGHRVRVWVEDLGGA